MEQIQQFNTSMYIECKELLINSLYICLHVEEAVKMEGATNEVKVKAWKGLDKDARKMLSEGIEKVFGTQFNLPTKGYVLTNLD